MKMSFLRLQNVLWVIRILLHTIRYLDPTRNWLTRQKNNKCQKQLLTCKAEWQDSLLSTQSQTKAISMYFPLLHLQHPQTNWYDHVPVNTAVRINPYLIKVNNSFSNKKRNFNFVCKRCLSYNWYTSLISLWQVCFWICQNPIHFHLCFVCNNSNVYLKTVLIVTNLLWKCQTCH